MERQHSSQAPGIFGTLVRHFFGRFFDTESLSPQGEPEVGVTQALGILATPGAFFVLVFRPLTLTGWNLVAARYMFISFSMTVMGFLMVFEWNALFPDRRDYQVLTPLPVRLSTLFLAKAAALAIFLGIFLLDVNFFSVLLWPGVDGGNDFFGILWAHVTAVLASGLFAALATAALHGLLITFLRGWLYRRVSVAVQTILMALLVMNLFLTPLVAFRIPWVAAHHPDWLYWFPGFWFSGFYENIRPATHNLPLRELGVFATRALWCAATLFLLTFLPGYRGHARRVLETTPPATAGPGRLRTAFDRLLGRTLLRNPVEYAVFHFISQTITRSLKHRLFLATYGGFGAAYEVMTFGSGPSGLMILPLTLSFLLVSGLRAAFNFPAELSANWTFQLSEINGAQAYLAATRKWILVCAILPLFLLMAPMEFAYFPPAAALFHLAYGITTSVLLMEVMFFGFRKVAFTCAHLPGKVNLVFLGVMYIFGFSAYSSTMRALEARLTHSPVLALAFFALAGALYIAVSRSGRKMLGPNPVLDFEDPAEPIVRTLGLATR
ncbi:MAG: hypothetical protein NTW28_05595 [Candidatus Solibacter sp.]|nr:hypothetical protein [Candidatus Solibacter sp.]